MRFSSARLFTILIVGADEVVFSGADDDQAQRNPHSAGLADYLLIMILIIISKLLEKLLESIDSLLPILFCMSQQVQERKCRNKEHMLSRFHVVRTKVIVSISSNRSSENNVFLTYHEKNVSMFTYILSVRR